VLVLVLLVLLVLVLVLVLLLLRVLLVLLVLLPAVLPSICCSTHKCRSCTRGWDQGSSYHIWLSACTSYCGLIRTQ
jgi:hypothetical protein